MEYISKGIVPIFLNPNYLNHVSHMSHIKKYMVNKTNTEYMKDTDICIRGFTTCGKICLNRL